MTGEDLLKLPDAQLEKLAAHGRIGPAIGRGHGGELVDRIAAGVKPATLIVSAAAAAYAVNLGLIARAVYSLRRGQLVDFEPWPDAVGSFAPDDPANRERLVYAVAGTAEAMDTLEAAFHRSQLPGEQGLIGSAELGFALGYSLADVAAYILKTKRRSETVAIPDSC